MNQLTLTLTLKTEGFILISSLISFSSDSTKGSHTCWPPSPTFFREQFRGGDASCLLGVTASLRVVLASAIISWPANKAGRSRFFSTYVSPPPPLCHWDQKTRESVGTFKQKQLTAVDEAVINAEQQVEPESDAQSGLVAAKAFSVLNAQILRTEAIILIPKQHFLIVLFISSKTYHKQTLLALY